MIFMKKFLCCILTILLIIGLFGCSVTSPENVQGEIITDGNNQDNKDTKQEEKEPEFSLGKTKNNTYENDFLGLSCTLPDGWTFYTEKQILELNNIVEGVLDEKTAEQLKNATIVYDMFAACEADGNSINVNLEKLSALQMVKLNVKQILESQIDAITTAYQNMGYTDIQVAYQEVTVNSKVFDGLKLTAKIQNVDFYAVIFAFNKSNYLANVSLCSLFTNKTDTLLSCFTVK